LSDVRRSLDLLEALTTDWSNAMKRNLGPIDKGIRIGAALIIAALYTVGVIGGVPAVILGIVAFLLVVTSAISFCPLYYFLGISTRESV
jgi:Inner membrane protein YgaP-like, transmembrane domain